MLETADLTLAMSSLQQVLHIGLGIQAGRRLETLQRGLLDDKATTNRERFCNRRLPQSYFQKTAILRATHGSNEDMRVS